MIATMARTTTAPSGRGHGAGGKTGRRTLRTIALAGAVAACALGAQPAMANHQDGAGQSFTTLQPGFTQDLFGTSPEFFGGVAFAPDGDPLVDGCSFSGSGLRRFDRQSVLMPDPTGSELHPSTLQPSNAGCGLTNHPDGSLYSNTGSGVVNLDANTGAQLRGPFGGGGNALGIAVDPQTSNIVYVLGDGTLSFVNQAFTTTGTFSSATAGLFVDGIAFDPAGNYLFIADRTNDALKVLNRAGSVVTSTPLAFGNDPDGIAFKATAPKFVVTNNGDGTITRFDFPADDYTMTPTQSLLASGGFRGDLSQVGPDGCLYVTQSGVRFDDGTTSSDNSLVRICPGFAPPPGAGTEGPPGDPTCSDGIDNDGDTLVDGADSDCGSGPPPACDVALVVAGCWRFGEPSGTVALDSSGNGNNGTYLGGVTLGQPGVIAGNTAALFDGFNDTVRIPNSISLKVGSSFSLEAWVKRTSTAKSQELMNKGANGFQLTVMSAGSSNQVWLRKAGVNTLARSNGGILADGRYHHIVATMSGAAGSEKIYIDGALDTAPVIAPQIPQNTTFPLTFGSAASSPTFHDEFVVYGRALSAPEVATRFARGTP